MNEKGNIFGLNARGPVGFRKSLGISQLVIGGTIIWVEWLDISEDVIPGLRGIALGAVLVLFGLSALANQDSRRLRTLYLTLIVVLFVSFLYMRFWLEK